MEPLINPLDIADILIDCVLIDDKREDMGVILEFYHGKYTFDSRKLEKNSTKITDVIDRLNWTENGISLEGFHFDRNGLKWTELDRFVEQLIVLGVANHDITYNLDGKTWQDIPSNMPIFIRSIKEPSKIK